MIVATVLSITIVVLIATVWQGLQGRRPHDPATREAAPAVTSAVLAARGAPTALVGDPAAGSPPATITAGPPVVPPAPAAQAPAPSPGVVPGTIVSSPGVAVATSSPQRVAAALAALRTGHFETEINYANGTRSIAVLHFDLGGGQQPARLYSRTTFQGVTGARAAERIVIGERTWARQQDQSWAESPTTQPVQEEVQALLPGTDAMVAQARADGPTVLRWFDPARDADTLLETDTRTGVPLRMRQATRALGTVLTVEYRGWNTPVDIAPPAPVLATRAPSGVHTPTGLAGPPGTARATPSPTRSASAWLAAATAAESGLRSGEFEATIVYGAASRSVVTVRFDLGDGATPRRIQIITATENAGARETRERIAIGEQSWERTGDGPWSPAASLDGVWDQLEAYLPQTRAIASATVASTGATLVLRYFDGQRDAETTLALDPETGVPREFRQTMRSGVDLRVVFRSWNTPVDVRAPPVH